MNGKERGPRFWAIVIYNNPRIRNVQEIAQKEAQRSLGTTQVVDLAEMLYSSVNDVFIALFKLPKEKDET